VGEPPSTLQARSGDIRIDFLPIIVIEINFTKEREIAIEPVERMPKAPEAGE